MCGKNIYGSKLVKIPTPRFAVFYNGDEKQPEQYELKLSESFFRIMLVLRRWFARGGLKQFPI